jgi:hypothetical protein
VTVFDGLSELLRHSGGKVELSAHVEWEKLAPESWLDALAACCTTLLAHREKLVLCISGKAGSGKSTLGRMLRKRGMPGIPPADLLVIDDGMVHLKWLGIFPRRVKHRSKTHDYLAPFAPLFAGRRLLIYVNTTPERRIDRCDILLRLRCPEDERQARLIARDPDGQARFASTRDASDNPQIVAERYLELQSAQVDFRRDTKRRT